MMVSRIEKFKAAAFEHAGKDATGRVQHVLLAVLIGVGMIAWGLLRFYSSVLAIIAGDDGSEKYIPTRSARR